MAFGQKKREQAGQLWVRAGIEALKMSENDLVRTADETGLLPVPDSDPEKGWYMYKLLAGASQQRDRDPSVRANHAMGRAMAHLTDAINEDQSMNPTEKRLLYRQGIIASADIYAALCRGGSIEAAILEAKDLLSAEEDWLRL